jgi:hypothetical protein
MYLVKRFEMVSCEHATIIAEMMAITPCWIVKAARCNTRFGQAILITRKDYSNRLSHVFLPGIYLTVFTDNDMLKNTNRNKTPNNLSWEVRKVGALSLSLTTADI